MLHIFPSRAGSRCGVFTLGLGLCAAASFLGVFGTGHSVLAQVAVTNAVVPGQTAAGPDQPAVVTTSTRETTRVEPTLTITGDELPGAYGAPGAFSRSRFSPLTTAYVLPPGSVYAALIYEGDAFREGKPDHLITQEVEVGLPYRFGLALENRIEHFNGDTENSSFSIEGRYALADWGKIPLNPTIFAEYKFGTGKILHEEGPPPPPEEAAAEDGPPDRPDAYEFRLLLSQEFGGRFEWAFNAFFERENTGDRGREWGFAQSIQTPILLPRERLKAGLEMQYQNFTVKDTRGSPIHRFSIGPSVSFKPAPHMRFDLTPLFGVTKDSPRVQVFAIFSYVFGADGESNEAEAPTSTRNR
ncbi:MAG: hypothetical protein ABI787_02700 [Spartobacteria bacterium]